MVFEQDVFNTTNDTFSSPEDSGTWSGGGSMISMLWSNGSSPGLAFSGPFVSTTTPVEYKGVWSYKGVAPPKITPSWSRERSRLGTARPADEAPWGAHRSGAS